MKRISLFVLLLALASSFLRAQEPEKLVLIDTDLGKIKVKLYNETPLHRDNFLKNVEAHRYDSLLFHRVIKQFMIQAGDLNSKNAPLDQQLGDGDLDYTVPAEIVYPTYFHKKGMLCAARTGDELNPSRASSATQFYIVTGKVFTEMELDKMEKAQDRNFTPEQRQAYMSDGGAPHLDGQYTVFGEVVSGIKTVDKIQMTATNEHDRPLTNIRIKTMTVVKK
ncbi:MAG: peptidylprolyl isomerase [Tannerellaceae bacterium]|jgi:peptidylprolyl isomerase/peptidyl-prolyl cis-trans isomerase B (cyclophilin B)|nr:peptidylprolyl isomerase [Tannerellaceae bacterium]